MEPKFIIPFDPLEPSALILSIFIIFYYLKLLLYLPLYWNIGIWLVEFCVVCSTWLVCMLLLQLVWGESLNTWLYLFASTFWLFI